MGLGTFILFLGGVCIVVSSVILAGNLTKLEARLPNNNQPLATTCYVDEKTLVKPEPLKPETPRPTHYFYVTQTRGGLTKTWREGCFIKNQVDNKVEIEYNHETVKRYPNLFSLSRTWLPKDQVFKYHTLEELSETINKKGERNDTKRRKK